MGLSNIVYLIVVEYWGINRAAVEYEKKTREANLELSQAMDMKMNSLQRDIDMLRAELANTEKRARAAAAASNPGMQFPELHFKCFLLFYAVLISCFKTFTNSICIFDNLCMRVSCSDPGYMGNYGSRGMAYEGGPYSVQYSMHQVWPLFPSMPKKLCYYKYLSDVMMLTVSYWESLEGNRCALGILSESNF